MDDELERLCDRSRAVCFGSLAQRQGRLELSWSVGRTDFAGGDAGTLVESIGRLMDAYPADTVVLPGHGPVTTLGAERGANPFLGALRA